MPNIKDFILNSTHVKKIEVDKLLFVEFKCPMEEERSHVWCDNNFFAHALSGSTVLKTPTQEYTLNTGDSAFAKKGGVISSNNAQHDFCELLIFVPDDFIKAVISKYQIDLSRADPHPSADSMIDLPVLDKDGFPIQVNGVTNYPGLYFVGMPWMPSERSGFLLGVGESAKRIALLIEQKSKAPTVNVKSEVP